MNKENPIVGRTGEDEVVLWADKYGCTPNRAFNDEKGWDIILQFPHDEKSQKFDKYPLDIRPPVITCLVQIKTTNQKSYQINDIKLSNWEHLVKTPIPTFFIILDYANTDQVQAVYLIHIDKYWIGKTLKRLRELQSKGIMDIHKKRMTLKYSESQNISGSFSNSLFKKIQSYVGSDPKEYFEKKIHWINTVGYDEIKCKGKLIFPKMKYEQLMNLLVDFSIGDLKELPLEKVEMEEIRFGLPRSIEQLKNALEIKLTINSLPSSKKARLYFKDKNDSIIFQDLFDVYSPLTMFPFIPLSNLKIKFYSKNFTFYFSPSNNDFRFRMNDIDVNEKVSIQNLFTINDLFKTVYNSDFVKHKLVIGIEGSRVDPIQLEITSTNFSQVGDDFKRILDCIENTRIILHYFNYHENKNIRLTDLLFQKDKIFLMRSLIANDPLAVICGEFEEENVRVDLENVSVVLGTYCVFSDLVFLVIGCVQGKGDVRPKNGVKEIIISQGKSRCLKTWKILMSDMKNFPFKESLNEASKILEKEGVQTVIVFDK